MPHTVQISCQSTDLHHMDHGFKYSLEHLIHFDWGSDTHWWKALALLIYKPCTDG